MHELVLNVFFKFEYEKKLTLNIYFLLKKNQVVFFFGFYLNQKPNPFFLNLNYVHTLESFE